MSKEEQSGLPKKSKSMKLHLVVASILFVFDALVSGQGVITFLVLATFLCKATIQALIAVTKKNPFPKQAFVKAGIYLGCFLAIVSTILVNNRIASKRAEVIVSAIKQYKEKHSRFPDSLQNLVPEFLPSVPKAKYSLAFNEFTYRRFPKGRLSDDPLEGALFYYTTLPPFGRPTYNFKKDHWGYID